MLKFIRPEAVQQLSQETEHNVVVFWYFTSAVAREPEGESRPDPGRLTEEVPDGTIIFEVIRFDREWSSCGVFFHVEAELDVADFLQVRGY